MKKCTKNKNACKLCLQTVTNKTGMQCKGACKRWAHYSCLNYTPGKIQDIKAGVITIACPCPTCNTVEPKEVLTNPPYTCENSGCPANLLAKCDNTECPINSPKQCFPTKARGKMQCGAAAECPSGCQIKEINSAISPDKTPPPSSKVVDKRRSSNDTVSCKSEVKDDEPSYNTGRGGRSSRKEERRSTAPKTEPSPKRERKDKIKKPPEKLPEISCERSASGEDSWSQRDEDSDYQEKPKQSKTPPPKPRTDKSLRSEGKTRSCSCMSTTSKADNDMKKSFSDHAVCSSLCKESHKALMCNIQQLCSTVGHLSNQVKQLMCRMME